MLAETTCPHSRAVLPDSRARQTLLETSIITGALLKVELNDKDKINHCQVIAAKSTNRDDLSV